MMNLPLGRVQNPVLHLKIMISVQQMMCLDMSPILLAECCWVVAKMELRGHSLTNIKVAESHFVKCGPTFALSGILTVLILKLAIESLASKISVCNF